MKSFIFAFGTIILLMLIIPSTALSQQKYNPKQNFAIMKKGESIKKIEKQAAHIIPSPNQFTWQKMEMIAFTHFGMNTFAGAEIGSGEAPPSEFNPTNFDPDQWVKVLKSVGFKMLILTTKHHDGFCLWPSKYTKYSVKYSKWENGKGDVVGAVAKACHKYGLKFGVYCSPWDRHEKTYGTPQYNAHFRNQLRELLTNYGKISEVWFDGYRGPGAKKEVYDWKSFYKLIRKLQPGAVISGMGPDVRWVGTETGYGRNSEWGVVPINVSSVQGLEQSKSEYPIDAVFVPTNIMGEEPGALDKLENAKVIKWYPSEADVSIRPGWFYHADQDSKVKSPRELVDIYFSSVGKNSVLLLNVPPDKQGLINKIDISNLMGMRSILDETFNTNFVEGAKVSASNEKKGFDAENIVDNKGTSYWTTKDGIDTASIIFNLPNKQTFDVAMLQEYIEVGQRVSKFSLQAWDGKNWKEFTKGTTIGYKRLLRFDPVETSKVKLIIEQSRANPTLSNFGLFKLPAEMTSKIKSTEKE